MSEKIVEARRRLLALAALLPAVVAGEAWGQACETENLTPAQQSMRRSLGYMPASDDPQKVCSGCAFYTASKAAGCGHCQLLNGPVAGGARCGSWAAKK